MTVLVAYASHHGSTREIAERLAATLSRSGVPAEPRSVEDTGDVLGFDAYVIGSAVYFGGWRREAMEFVHDHAEVLVGRPVWLFSSGPLQGPLPADEWAEIRRDMLPEQAEELDRLLRPIDHRVFRGALDPEHLDVAERIVTALPVDGAMRAGDFRDWQAIDAWAEAIAVELTSRAPGSG